MKLLPQPLFGSARILNDCDFSGYSPATLSARAFLIRFESALQPIETHELAHYFLADRRDWPSYESCRTAIERLILWALLIRKKPLLSLDRSDAFDFIWFLQEPPDSWLCEKAPLRFIKELSSSGLETIVPNPKWRPFAKGRLPTEFPTLYKTLTACSAFYTYLVRTSSAVRNPFAELISQEPRTEVANAPTAPSMVSSDWKEVLSAAERLAIADPIMHERTLFIVAAQAHLKVACSDFFDSEGKVITLRHFVRRGNAWLLRLDSGDITIANEFISLYFRRFCNFRGINLDLGAAEPIVSRIKGYGQVTRRTLVKITKDAVCEALRYMEIHGATQARLKSFSDAYKVWVYSDATQPEIPRLSEIAQISPDAELVPKPLFADYLEVVRSDGGVDDHPDTLLYLASCPEAAMPRKAYEHAKEYLYKYRNRNTYEAYRKYIERLLLWTFLIKGKSLYKLNEMDLHEFNGFCKFPPRAWVRTSFERRFTKVRAGSRSRGPVLTTMNPNWRPFWIDDRHAECQESPPYHSSSETSAGQFTVARSLYDFLLSKKAVEFNPLFSRDSFVSYSHRRRAVPRAQRGASEAVFQKVIAGSFTLLSGWDLRRMLFVIYTVNELRLSRSDIRSIGSLLRFSCFNESDGAWTATLPCAEGALKSLSVSSKYAFEVLLPYKFSLQTNDVSFTDSCPLFVSKISGAVISDRRISQLLSEVCQFAAAEMQRHQENDAFIDAVRSITINALANSCKPSEYRLKKALPEQL